jgi:hypothetical protein
MFLKNCSSCNTEKDLNEFSEQKKNPGKLYAWCDACRKSAAPLNLGKAKREFYSEVAAMQAKALELRKFDNAQVEAIRKAKAEGTPVKELAAQHQTSTSTIRRVIRGAGTYGKVK